jgi:hypothetical protein
MRIEKDTCWAFRETEGYLLNITTGHKWEAHYWDNDDYETFLEHSEGNKWGQVENMILITEG